MIQGYENSPAIFQRGIKKGFEGLIGVSCYVHLDDLIVFGSDELEHDENFKKVENKLYEYNLKINESKLVYKETKVDYLGYTISLNCITSTQKRSQGI